MADMYFAAFYSFFMNEIIAYAINKNKYGDTKHQHLYFFMMFDFQEVFKA